MITKSLTTLTILSLIMTPLSTIDSAIFSDMIARFLDISEPPASAQIIVVFAGGGGERIEYAARLVESGYADTILVLGTEAEKRFALSILNRRIPEGDLRLILPRANVPNTDTSARFAARWLEVNQVNSAMVVSHDWHLRRIRLLMSRHASWSNEVSLRYCAPPTRSSASPHESSILRRTHIIECAKTVGSAILSFV